MTREQEPLLGGRELLHDLQRLLPAKLRRCLQRRQVRSDRPLIDVIAARRLLAVLALARSRVEQRGIGLEHRPYPFREP